MSTTEDLNQVRRCINIRVSAMGYSSLKAFTEACESNGCERDYQWWHRLGDGSRVEYIKEAARWLGVSSGSLMGEDDQGLLRESHTRRIQLNE